MPELDTDRWRQVLSELVEKGVRVGAPDPEWAAEGDSDGLASEDSHALVVIAGEDIVIRFPAEDVPCPPGAVVLIPAGLPARVDASADPAGFLRVFGGADGALRVIHDRRPDGKTHAARLQHPGAEVFAHALAAAVAVPALEDDWGEEGCDSLVQQQVEIAVRALIAALAAQPQPGVGGDPLVVIGVRWLQEHLAEPGADLASLAAHLDRHPDTVSRGFRDRFGKGPMDVLRDLRLDRARRMLLQADLSITQVATACGFADRRYFTRVFKQAVGHTPRDWRRHGHHADDVQLGGSRE